MNEFRTALYEEVEFWGTMLKESPADPGSPEYQRMVMALRLAEQRLSSIDVAFGNHNIDGPPPLH